MVSDSTRVRIVISINTSWNIYNFRRGLILSLLARGYDVVALAPPDEYAAKLIEMGCAFVPISVDNKGVNPQKDLLLTRDYYKLLRKLRPDIFLSYTIKPNIYGSTAAHLLGVPVINNVSGLGTAFLGNGMLRKIVEVLYRSAFRRSQRIFFQNKEDLSLFLERGLVRKEQVDCLPGSGIDLSYFEPQLPPEYDDGQTKFLLIGRLLYDKGIGEYVKAARLLKAEGLNAQFSILGFLDVVNRTAVARQTMDAWIAEGAIDYIGSAEDVRPHIAAADCVVLPSYREGTPRTLLEAAAMARPLVATDVPGCRDVIDDRQNGLLCQVKDPVDLARCMREIINMTREQQREMGLASRRKMERQFDEDLVIKPYLSAIDEVLARRLQ